MFKATDLFAVLSASVLVNRPTFLKVPSHELPGRLAEMQAHGKPLIFEDNVSLLTSPTAVVAKLMKGQDVSPSLELMGVELTAEELVGIRTMRVVVEKISSFKPDYPFDPNTPVGYDVEKEFTFGSQKITQKTGYCVGIKTAEKTWKAARDYWAGRSSVKHGPYMSYSGYDKSAQFNEDTLTIGCQTFKRYQIEQIAVKMGWEF